MRYFYILATLLFTVYGQIIIKWRLTDLKFAVSEGSYFKNLLSLLKLLLDPFILSGFVAAFVASLFWLLALTKFQITEAYPFMSLAPAIVFTLGIWLLNETFTWGKVLGIILIMIGIFVSIKL